MSARISSVRRVFRPVFLPKIYENNETAKHCLGRLVSANSDLSIFLFILLRTLRPSFSLRPRFSYHFTFAFHLLLISTSFSYFSSFHSCSSRDTTRPNSSLFSSTIVFWKLLTFLREFHSFRAKGNLQHSGVSFEANRYKLDVNR